MSDDLKKLMEAATPGTWSVTEDGDIRCEQIVTEDGETYTESCSIATGQCSQNWGYIHWGNLADAALIVAAVNALPELLAKVKRLEVLERLAPEYFEWAGKIGADTAPEWLQHRLKYGGANVDGDMLAVYDWHDRRSLAAPGDYVVDGEKGLWVLPARPSPPEQS